ncbi:hypothetical protein [Qipengyuania nanhaisediminis]|uniref:hypothetical protein n=1 Tax=Qipengyuania nanhaisediminis TaxID=604088 RepID=UPI0038B40C5B
MTSLILLLAPLFTLQGVGEAPTAIENDAPETWTLEYPRLIQPYVADYRRCLTGQMHRVTGEANFEMQHRADVPHCEEVSRKAQASANAALARSGNFPGYTEADVREIFEHVGRIHIARGADLDQQFTFFVRRRQAARDEFEANRPRGLVLELHDASVVKARTDATAAAAVAARTAYEQEMEQIRVEN